MLVCPLDWGLGHTTRCIPLIRQLMGLGCEVIIGCNSTQKEILFLEFQDHCRYIHLAGYGILYGKTRGATLARLMLQSLKILIRIKQENRWLRTFLLQEGVNAVISDNRFGLYATGLPSIFITHQLQIKTGLGQRADALVRRWNYRHINRFTTCWVPDEAGAPSLSGELSHPRIMPSLPVRYIGALSRMATCSVAGKGLLLIILSGPEPLRSIFEQVLLEQLKDYTGQVVMVRGLPLATALPTTPDHCKLLNHAPADMLQALICEAELVISRCGYTTVMDLFLMGKKSILVPTPGQAEQEYLAHHLLQQQWAYTLPQKGFQLDRALEEAGKFTYKIPDLPKDAYKEVVREFVEGMERPAVGSRES
ncbi:glycosyltransferase [Paraflavitalea speifideaquila]|uniref:glycosyltransferase n=1 Tax=Paraflavitalea speifideaquila TaxID=3076558 RepID=UPI0028E25D54|nr:glycosyltransferase [Paraflavitalea speifideiaquila]